MKEHLKTITKTSGTTLLGWLKVSFIGLFITLIDLIVGFYLLADNKNTGAGPGGHANGIGAVLVLFIVYFYYFTIDFFPALLTLLGFLAIPLFTVLANKYAINKMLFSLYNQKLSSILEEKIKHIIQRVLNKFPNAYDKGTSWKQFLLKLIKENNLDKSSPWIYRKAINHTLKKIKLDDVNFSDSNISLTQIVSSKIKQTLDETLEPSMKIVWLIFLINIVFIILAFWFNTK